MTIKKLSELSPITMGNPRTDDRLDGSYTPVVQIDDAGGGAPISSAAMPTGGLGLIGWLSAIWKVLSQGLTVTAGSIASITLLSNIAGTITGSAFLVPAGSYTVRAIGTFAGNTVKPQFLDIDGVTWSDIPKDDGTGNIAFTSAGSYSIDVTTDTYIRGVVTGVGASTGIYLAVA